MKQRSSARRAVSAATQEITRRRLLAMAGVASLSGLSAACTGGGQSGREASVSGKVQWWDQYRPLTTLFEKDLFGPYMKAHPQVTISRREMAGPDLAQALQIARRSNQLPDVHSIAGLESTPAALVEDGWFQPIDDLVQVQDGPVGEYLFDGIHRFGGKLYTFPVFTGRWHEATPWSNTALLEQADVDPKAGPATWDEFRATARKLTKATGDDVYGMVLPSKEPPYLSMLVHRLAQAAGAPGPSLASDAVVNWKTGEYIADSQPYVDAVEFLLSLKADGVIHPASPSMSPRDARARWAAGKAALYLWGPWFIGGLKVDEPQAVERGVGAWHVPTPGTTRNPIYSRPAPGPFWVSAKSKNATTAANLMQQMVADEFQQKLAATMDLPPVRMELVKQADAHPAYVENVAFMEADVRIGPAPEVGTPDVAKVQSEMRDVHPNIGQIVQTALTERDSNYKAALRRFTQQLTAERDRAIKVAKKAGAEVDTDAWVFGNWDPTKDYTQSSYRAR